MHSIGFHYAGPIVATIDYSCVTCLAALRKICPTHGEAWVVSCAHCASAQGAPCQAHWGLQAALDEYTTRLEDESEQADFEIAKSIILAEALGKKTKVTVEAKSRGSFADPSDGVRAFSVIMR